MDHEAAMDLIRAAVGPGGGTWADFGAGRGTFTRALAALLGPDARVVAVDREPGAVAALRRLGTGLDAGDGYARVVAVAGDFAQMEAIGELEGVALDGALFANALHFVPDAERVLAQVRESLVPDGRVVVVEYDRVTATRWVPHPLPPHRLAAAAEAAGLPSPRVTARRPSRYQGALYCAVMNRHR